MIDLEMLHLIVSRGLEPKGLANCHVFMNQTYTVI